MNARTLEIMLALQALEVRLLALLDSRTAALWSLLPSPPVGEIDAAQERGEVATPKDGAAVRDLVRDPDKVTPATYEDLGLSRQRGAEWRELGDAGEPGSDFDTIVSKLPAAEAHHHG